VTLPRPNAVWWSTDDWHEAARLQDVVPSLVDSLADVATADRLVIVRNDLPRVAKLYDKATGPEQLTSRFRRARRTSSRL
jgi:hypothetical protein